MASSENENDSPQVYLLGKTYLANNQGQFYIRNDPIAYMAAGDRHTIILTESGRAFAFGDNSSGQLGLGHTNPIEKVSCIKSLKFGDTGEKVILAACGRESSLVATNHGAIYGFGSNSRAQLGSEPSESKLNQPTPVKIEFRGTFNWTQIAMGAEHACALNDEGVPYVWGANDEGQCGQIKKTDMVVAPRELRTSHPVVSISCGYYHTALVDSQGQLYVFGNNEDRQLGRDVSNKFSGPEKVSIPNKVVAVACGHQHTVVLTDKGEVYATGLGDRGQLGFGQRVFSSEVFQIVPGLPKRVTAIAAGEAHTAVIGPRNDMYVFGDGKHGKLGSATTTYSNEFEPCRVEKLKNFNVLKVVCGGCQTIVLAQKKSSESKKSSGSEEDIGNATLSVTQRPKSLARSMRNKNQADRSTAIGDSLDSTMQQARPLGKSNLRVESDNDRSDNELSESMKSATFNQTHTITNGRFRPTQSPSMNRNSFRSNDDDGSKTLKTGVMDRTARLTKEPDDLGKTSNRLPSLEKAPVRNTRFDQPTPKRRDSDDEEKSSSDEQRSSFRKKPEPSVPVRNERKPVSRSPSPPPVRKQPEPPVRKSSPATRRQNGSDSETDKRKRSSPVRARQQKLSEDEDEEEEEEEDEDEEEESPRKSSRQTKPPPPTVVRRGSLPQTRSGNTTLPRDGNQTIGSRPVDGVRGSFRTPATKTLAKPAASNQSIESTKKETPPAPEPGFWRRLFGAKPATPPPTPAPEKKPTTTTAPAAAATPATNASSRTCSIM